MRRGSLALAATAIALTLALGVPDAPRWSLPRAQTPASPVPIAAGATPAPSARTSPGLIWRLDVGPAAARISPDARLVAVESGGGLPSVAVYEIRPPVAPSDVAQLREIARLARVLSPVVWLPDSSGLLAWTPDGPSSSSGTLSLVGNSGVKWSIATTNVAGVSGARLAPDARSVALWANPSGAIVVALDGTTTRLYPGSDERSFAGWDAEGNVLFRLRTANALEAQAPDGRVAYTLALPEELRYLSGAVAEIPQPPDMRLLWFASGCCAPSRLVPLLLFDRALHEIPADLEGIPTTIGDGPWRGSGLIVRRKADAALMTFDPRTGATRPLGLNLSIDGTFWGVSGDYVALGRRIVELSTGRELTFSAIAGPEVITAIGAGRFALWRDGATQLLDATAWMAAPYDLTGALVAASDQAGVQPGWVRVRDDDGGFTIVLPRSWHAYDGRARGAVLASEELEPSTTPSSGEMRVDIRLDIAGPRGPGDFLDGLAHHGGGVLERRTVQLGGQSAEFAIVYDNTMYPRPATTLNWALRSPFFPERVVWIRAWPLDSGRRAEAEAIVASLQFVAPR